MKNCIIKTLISIWILCIFSTNITLGRQHAREIPVELNTANGIITGINKGEINAYKGIPYAKPPIENLRFAPPENVDPWSEPLDCKKFGNVSVQTKSELKMSEDSLNLNIWTPAKPNDNKQLPVYVYIHGGAFTSGSGADSLYDGTNFAKKGIVVVTINYRLAALGFMASKETYNTYGTTGNWGLLDQIKALEWINENISTFGGDKNNITVGGESSGAYSLSALMLSPLAKGLFQKAILESGDILSLPGNSYHAKGDLEHSIEASNIFAEVFDAKDNAEGLAKMRTVDANVLATLSAVDMDFTKSPAFFLLPVYDGYVIPKNPVKALSNGEFNKVKLLYGYNTDEGSVFIPLGLKQADYETFVYKTFGANAAEQVLERFPTDVNNTPTKRARQMLKYALFSTGMKTIADAYSANGIDVWAYNFTYIADPVFGARHGAELGYIFDNIRRNLLIPQKKLVRQMHPRWVNFIKNGNPSTEKEIWPKYNPQDTTILEFGKKVEVKTMPDKDDLEFMQGLMFSPLADLQIPLKN